MKNLIIQDTKNKSFIFKDDFASPLLQEIKDPYELSLTYNKLPIIPFFGSNEDSSDIVLNLLHRVHETTPASRACTKSILEFTVGAGFELTKKSRLFKFQDEITDDEKLNFEEILYQHLYDTDLNNLVEDAALNLLIDGNAFFKLEISNDLFKISKFDTTKVRYTVDKKHVIYSNSFRSDYILSQKPILYPVFPNYSNNDGVITTVFHAKVKSPSRDYYGLSSGSSSLLHQYLSNQLMYYVSAETDNRFTGKVFFDTELSETDSENDIGDANFQFLEHMKKVYTNKGAERSSVLARFREKGISPTSVTQFNAKTDEGFYKAMDEILSNQVVISYAWDKRLIGISRENGLGGNDMSAIFEVASQKVKTLQHTVMKTINQCIELSSKMIGFDADLQGYQLKLGNLHQQLMKEKQTQDANNQ